MDKFPSAIYKKFGSEQDAWAFVRSQSAATSSFERPKGNLKGVSLFKMTDVPYTPLIKIHASSGFQVSKEKRVGGGGLRISQL